VSEFIEGGRLIVRARNPGVEGHMPMPAEVIMPASVFGLSMRETRLWNEGYNAALADVRQRLCDICQGQGLWVSKEGAEIPCDCSSPAPAENPNDADGDPKAKDAPKETP
jgi:hypothetical protein